MSNNSKGECLRAAVIADFFDQAYSLIPPLGLFIAFVTACIAFFTSNDAFFKVAGMAIIFTGIIFFPLSIAASKTNRYFWHIMDKTYPPSA